MAQTNFGESEKGREFHSVIVFFFVLQIVGFFFFVGVCGCTGVGARCSTKYLTASVTLFL